MSQASMRQLEPDRFCVNDGVETGIRVADGRDLCLDCYREYLAGRAQPRSFAVVAAPQGDLFGRAA